MRIHPVIALLLSLSCGTAKTTSTLPDPCDATQARISAEADARASPLGIDAHLAVSFPGGKVAWLMKAKDHQSYVVDKQARHFGRCNADGCFVFAGPAQTLEAAVATSMNDGKHDAALLAKALGLPTDRMEGPLRLLTLELGHDVCARLPVDGDPGAWPCKSDGDTDCFRFGGFTTGGVPELLLVNAPVARAHVVEIP
ncbi:MAG: hypothetical protein Q8O67_03340 [Deltaproteobacteria bacterium]|nr:hypothetical protein [Deltaproteobacteria bacterium]